MQLYELEAAITIKTAVSNQSKSFFQLTHDNVAEGRAALFTQKNLAIIISKYVLMVANNSFNLGQPLTSIQAYIIATDLQHERPEYGLEDVVCLMRMARTGQFGTIYNRLDPATFFEWVQMYADQRADAWEQNYNNEKHSLGSPARDSRVIGLTDSLTRREAPGEKMFGPAPPTKMEIAMMNHIKKNEQNETNRDH